MMAVWDAGCIAQPLGAMRMRLAGAALACDAWRRRATGSEPAPTPTMCIDPAVLDVAMDGKAAARVTPGRLVLLRHGQSAWNKEGRFTGWANVPLTAAGEAEAADAAALLLAELGEIAFDACYTSVLNRSVRTGEVVLGALGEAQKPVPPLRTRWRLNERHYGALTGLNKREALRSMDARDLRRWRLSFGGRPPPMEPGHAHYSREPARHARLNANDDDEPLPMETVPLTESLADTVERVRPLWLDELRPAVLGGQNLLVVGHANCMRALISCIQSGIGDDKLSSLGVPNALPLVYAFDEASGEPAILGGADRCYVSPLDGYYLGDACVMFNALDVDGSGNLNAEEISRVGVDGEELCGNLWSEYLGKNGGGAGEKTCGEELIDEADVNNDGLVDFNEYMTWWAKQGVEDRGVGGGGSRAGKFR